MKSKTGSVPNAADQRETASKIRSDVIASHRSFIVATVMEVGLLLLLLYVMWGSRSDYMDFVILPFIAAFILALALGWGGLSKALDSKVSGYLGGICGHDYCACDDYDTTV